MTVNEVPSLSCQNNVLGTLACASRRSQSLQCAECSAQGAGGFHGLSRQVPEVPKDRKAQVLYLSIVCPESSTFLH